MKKYKNTDLRKICAIFLMHISFNDSNANSNEINSNDKTKPNIKFTFQRNEYE